LPLTDSESTSRCGQCLQHPPSFDRTVALYAYHDPINTLINQLKFHHRLSNAVIFGKLLAEKISQAYANDTFPEMIIPIPLHKKRLRQRGFNQAVEIGKITAKQLHIQLARFNSQRVRNTEPQSLLPQKKRQQNIKAAFSVTNINAKHVAVLDDVVTTTATVNEFCRTLRKAGVEKIDVWCIARTIPGKN
jgi:ComF family protein